MTEILKDIFAKNFDRVNKQEKYLSGERQKIEAMSREIETLRKDAEAFRSLKGKNPFDILENFGITYDKLIEADKERNRDPYMQQQMKELKELKEMLNQERMEKEQREHESKERELIHEIRSISEAKGYDIIHKLGMEESVYKHIRTHYNTKGEVLDIDDACQQVLKEVTSQFKGIKDSKWLAHEWDAAQALTPNQPAVVAAKGMTEVPKAPLSKEDQIKHELAILRAKRNNADPVIREATPGMAAKETEGIVHAPVEQKSRADKLREVTEMMDAKLRG